MSYAQENGYVPETFDAVMNEMRLAINTHFDTTFTELNFVGSNYYKFLYGPVQKLISIGVKASEIFLKLQEYIETTNQKVLLPTGTYQGLIDAFARAGYIISVGAGAGTLHIYVDIDHSAPDYPEWKLEICNLIKQYVSAGIETIGLQTEELVLSNGQSFEFSFDLPTYLDFKVRVNIAVSPNHEADIPSETELKQMLFENIYNRYRLGWQFEPQRYLTIADLPWAESITLEWSDDAGSTWNAAVWESDVEYKVLVAIEDIQVTVT